MAYLSRGLFNTILLFICLESSVASQEFSGNYPKYHITYGVSDWREVANKRAVEFKVYRNLILNDQSYTSDEKARMISAKYSEIQNLARRERTSTYSAVSKFRSVENSCTNQSSTPKECDEKCVSAPLPDMYTSLDLVQGWWGGDVTPPSSLKPNGNRMGNDRVSSNRYICAGKLKQSGKGRKTSYAEGKFRIRPEKITQIVNEEMVPIMYFVSTTPN